MTRFKILTYNLKAGSDSSLSSLSSVVSEINADIAAFQETGRFWPVGAGEDQASFIASNCGYECFHFFPALTHENSGEFGLAILSKFPMTEFFQEKLFRRMDEQRILAGAEIEIAGKKLLFFNTHLSIISEERREQALFISEILSKYQDKPVLFAGDINDVPGSDVIKTLSKHLRSALPVHPAPTFPSGAPAERLDYIFVSRNIKIIEPADPAVISLASDHLPVASVMEF
jgi:endonuclease/exonuclease/phosphatase family metal-dependent hydrolase